MPKNATNVINIRVDAEIIELEILKCQVKLRKLLILTPLNKSGSNQSQLAIETLNVE